MLVHSKHALGVVRYVNNEFLEIKHKNVKQMIADSYLEKNDSMMETGEEGEDDKQKPTHVQENETRSSRPSLYKSCKAIVLWLTWICIGLWDTMITPCVDILKDQVNADYEEISQVMAAKSIGVICGALIGGYLADKFQRQIDLLLGLEVLLAGVALAVVPWIPSLLLMTVAFALNGLCQGGLSAGGNAHAIHIWGGKVTGPIHFIHFGYGIGTVLAPAIMAAFLPNNPTQHHAMNHSSGSTADGQPHHSVAHPDLYNMNSYDGKNINLSNSFAMDQNATSVDIKIPFAIVGGLAVFVAVLLLVFMCFPSEAFLTAENTPPRERPNKTFKEIISPGECAGGNAMYGFQMLVLISIFYLTLVGKEIGVTIFIEPIASNSSHLDFSLKETDILVTVYYICFACGQLIVALVGIFVQIQIIIFTESVACVAAVALIISFGLHSNLGFWLTNTMFAVCAGPMFPSGLAWIDQYLKMTGVAFAVLDVGIGIGKFTFTWLCGYLFKTHSHLYLYYLSLLCCVVELVALIIMQIRGHVAGDRYKQNLTEADAGVDDLAPLVQ